MHAEFEVIDALVDGECVDRDELKRALAEPAGRDYLVDVLDLRTLTVDTVPAVIALPGVRQRSWRSSMAAAAVLVLCVTGAYSVGQRVGRTAAPVVAPAAPVVMDRTVPGGGLMQAPAPTRIIRLDSDAKWTETPGGK
jgi:hypothetical protein